MKVVSRSVQTLRFPQPQSINKLRRKLHTDHGAVLADGMGVGKTATAVNVVALLNMNRILVVCPKSAIPDWRREIVAWDKRHGMIQLRESLLFKRGWTLLNYEMLQRCAGAVRKHEWGLIIIDEHHATKEPNRRRSILIYGGEWNGKTYPPIPHRKALIVSGTPFKNRIEELFEPLHFVKPAKWPDRDAFINAYYPSEFDQEGKRQRIITPDGRVVGASPINLDALHHRLQDDMVRTHKDNVPGLPKKRFELLHIPVQPFSEEWFYFSNSRRNLSRLYARMIGAQLAKDWDTAVDLKEKITALHADIAMLAIQLKGQSIIDYLLSLTVVIPRIT